MSEYSLENLIVTFNKHSKQNDEYRDKLLSDWKEDNPEEKMPEWMEYDFCINRALESICTEILAIKKQVKDE